ncbi:MAG TPA: DUF4349 domain-containing protein [Actinomycetota bacterium]
MRKAIVSVIGFLAVAGVIGYLATSGGGPLGRARSDSVGGGGAGASGSPVTEKGLAVPGPAEVADSSVTGAVSSGSGSLTGVGELPAIGPAIVKTARIDVEVKKDGFEAAFDAARIVAATYGGYVESSSTSGTKVRSGSLMIRVPAASFDQAMTDLDRLGTVKAQSMSGQDVTSQYVDLKARLTTWETQEAVLLRLMRRATSVEATLRVQRELQDVQFRIEQIKGQLRVLDNQTSLATIQLSLREPGAPIHVESNVSERPSLVEAWDKALNGFLGVLYSVVVGLGYLVPIAVIVAAAWLGYRRLRSRPAVAG